MGYLETAHSLSGGIESYLEKPDGKTTLLSWLNLQEYLPYRSRRRFHFSSNPELVKSATSFIPKTGQIVCPNIYVAVFPQHCNLYNHTLGIYYPPEAFTWKYKTVYDIEHDTGYLSVQHLIDLVELSKDTRFVLDFYMDACYGKFYLEYCPESAKLSVVCEDFRREFYLR